MWRQAPITPTATPLAKVSLNLPENPSTGFFRKPGIPYDAHLAKITGVSGVNPQWQAFLQDQGAVLEGGRVLHFGDPEAERRAARDDDVLVELSELRSSARAARTPWVF